MIADVIGEIGENFIDFHKTDQDFHRKSLEIEISYI